jgi:uncharacterized membrane protein YphA (DoxX/SURF4 family)
MAKKRRWTFASVGAIVARVAVGGLLLYAGVVKLGDMSAVADDVSHYKILPEAVHNIFGIMLPWNEVVIGLMLLLGLWTRAVSLLSAALFMIFIIAVTQALLRGIDIRCGCFGKAGSAQIGIHTLLIDGAGVLLSLWSYVGAMNERKGR